MFILYLTDDFHLQRCVTSIGNIKGSFWLLLLYLIISSDFCQTNGLPTTQSATYIHSHLSCPRTFQHADWRSRGSNNLLYLLGHRRPKQVLFNDIRSSNEAYADRRHDCGCFCINQRSNKYESCWLIFTLMSIDDASVTVSKGWNIWVWRLGNFHLGVCGPDNSCLSSLNSEIYDSVSSCQENINFDFIIVIIILFYFELSLIFLECLWSS